MRTCFRLSKAFQSTVFFQGKSQRKKKEGRKEKNGGENRRASAKTVDSWTNAEEDTDKGPETKEEPFEEILRVPARFPVASKSCLHSFQRNLPLWLAITPVQSDGASLFFFLF